VTTLYVALAFTLPGHRNTYSAESIIASCLFVPWPRLDGVMQPVIGQGWALNYEMLFYAVFALAVLARRRVAVASVAALLAAATRARPRGSISASRRWERSPLRSRCISPSSGPSRAPCGASRAQGRKTHSTASKNIRIRRVRSSRSRTRTWTRLDRRPRRNIAG
jgi:hypothetical protein